MRAKTENYFLYHQCVSIPDIRPKTQRDPDSEFNSMHYGLLIKKM